MPIIIIIRCFCRILFCFVRFFAAVANATVCHLVAIVVVIGWFCKISWLVHNMQAAVTVCRMTTRCAYTCCCCCCCYFNLIYFFVVVCIYLLIFVVIFFLPFFLGGGRKRYSPVHFDVANRKKIRKMRIKQP